MLNLLSVDNTSSASAEHKMAVTNQSVGGACKIETVEKVLQICWAKQKCKCLLGQGAYGSVYRGKWNQGGTPLLPLDVAVKVLNDGLYHVDYEIATLKKANPNILRFHCQVNWGPSR